MVFFTLTTVFEPVLYAYTPYGALGLYVVQFSTVPVPSARRIAISGVS